MILRLLDQKLLDQKLLDLKLLSWLFSWMYWFSSCFLPEVPDSPSVTLPNCPGSPPDFLLKFFILLFLFLLSWFLSWISWFSSSFLPEVPDSPPVSLPDCLVVLLILLAPLLNFLVRLEEGMRGFTQIMVLEGTEPYTMYLWVRLLWYRAIPCQSRSISVGLNRWLSLSS